MIALVYRDSLPQGTAEEFDQLVQGLTGMLYREHDPDGTHTNITANSVTVNKPNLTTGVAGTIVIQDRLGSTATLYRDFDSNSGDVIMRIAQKGLGASNFRIQITDVSAVLYNLVRLGSVQVAGGSFGNGILMYGKNAANDTSLTNVYHDWSMVSGDTNAAPGARMLIGDVTRLVSPISLRWRNTGNGIYEWMKTTGTSGPTLEQVNLGSGLDSSQAGYWDNLYVKSITLGNTVGPQGFGIGTWNDVPFSAGNFTAGGSQTWTVGNADQETYAYMIVGNTMTIAFYLNSTSVGGTPDPELRIAIPGGFTSGRNMSTTGWAGDNGVVTTIRFSALAGFAYLNINRLDGANWTASTNNTGLFGEITFAIA